MKQLKPKHMKKYILWGCAAAAVAVLAVMPLLAASKEEVDGPQASILSGTVQRGNVDAAIRGGGTLEAAASETVELPSGVKITGFLVENGDSVTAGTPLASIDRVTLMEAIVQVQDTLKESASAKEETVSSYIRATAGGRIKAIYAQEGDSVQEVMLRDGALAVLSLDGLMAVTLQRNMPLTTGETVCVTFDDDSETEGRVESNIDGQITITMDDEGYPIGAQVTVTTEDGTRVGRGELSVHNAWTATGFTGTIQTVSAQMEKTVNSGAALFTLTDTEYTAEMERLADEHREYEALLKRMMQMYEQGVITAPCDGLVSGIEEESTHLLAAEEVQWEAQLLSNTAGTEKSWRILLLSSTEETTPETETLPPEPPQTQPAPGEDGEVPGNPNADIPEDWEQLCTRDENCTADIHEEGCPKAASKEDGTETGTTGWAAVVISVDKDANVTWVMKDSQSITVSDPGNPPALNRETMTEVTSLSGTLYPDGSEIAVGDYLLLTDNGSFRKLSVLPSEDGKGEMPDMGAMGSMSGMGGAAVQEPVFEPYPLEGSTLLTISAQESMTLTIALDEQDVAKVKAGQAAEVQVSALRGQILEGTVTGVSRHGTNNGGSSKFTVEVTVPFAENMLAGMSATVTIPLYTRMDVLTIPVAALQEDGTRTVVYTALDSETGAPAAPKAVTIGLSDGETAEVLSGLAVGDTYYYSYYDTLEVSTEVERQRSFGR